jgi:hypothetical protein
MDVMKKSWKLLENVPSKLNPFLSPAASIWVVRVAPGEGFAPLLVPSQRWVPPLGVVMSLPWDSTQPSKIVGWPSAPSMRNFAFVAPGAEAVGQVMVPPVV